MPISLENTFNNLPDYAKSTFKKLEAQASEVFDSYFNSKYRETHQCEWKIFFVGYCSGFRAGVKEE